MKLFPTLLTLVVTLTLTLTLVTTLFILSPVRPVVLAQTLRVVLVLVHAIKSRLAGRDAIPVLAAT